MLMGPLCGSEAARWSIQSASPHSWVEVNTTEAVAGGTSVAWAKGSALSLRTPSRPRISNLYRVPSPISGTNSSHTPVAPIVRIGVAVPSQ